MKKLVKLCLPLGAAIFIIINLISRFVVISDYMKGLFEGISCVLMITGLIYVIIYFARGKNPYGKDKDGEDLNA